jgi:hypothetical protein
LNLKKKSYKFFSFSNKNGRKYMFSYFKYSILFVLLSINIFANYVVFNNPTSTLYGTPNISQPGEDNNDPSIASSKTGKYVYLSWRRVIGGNYQIQVGISSDFGQTFINPTTTPYTTPNLSPSTSTSFDGKIRTSDDGKYVYCAWRESLAQQRIQVAISSDYGVTWTSPTSTPGGAPNLSVSGQNASQPELTTDSSGKYVYCVWRRVDDVTTNTTIQVAISSDYGVTWANPTTVPGALTTPDLSDNNQNASDAFIKTNSTGQYVYAVWERANGLGATIVQVAISSTYGDAWADPTTVTGSGTPNLSADGNNASTPKLATDSSGKYVYAVWDRVNAGGNNIIQVAISSAYGDVWTNPTMVTGSGTPNLSDDGKNAITPEITTDCNTGKYVYAIWKRVDGNGNNIIQVSISSAYGDVWVDPTTVTGNGTPNLSAAGQNAHSPTITTDNSGRYVYAAWQRVDFSGNTIIQAAVSSDSGLDWSNPGATTQTTPNLSAAGQGATNPMIATSSSGVYIPIMWIRTNDSGDTIVQVNIGYFYPTMHFPVSALDVVR